MATDRGEASIAGLVADCGHSQPERALGLAKRRIGARLGSSATAREGTPNLLCAYLAMTVLAVLAASTLLGVWWLDGVAALGLAGWRWRKGGGHGPGDRAAAHVGLGRSTDYSGPQARSSVPHVHRLSSIDDERI